MSLVQHVSLLEGVDQEPLAEVDEDFTPITRKISYDVLQPPSQPVPVEEQPPETPPYKVSASTRLGMSEAPPICNNSLIIRSPGHLHYPGMLGRVWYSIWICSAEARPGSRGCLSQPMHR